MEAFEYDKAVENFLEEVKGYSGDWNLDIDYDNVSQDEVFLYLEIEPDQDIWESFRELGNQVDARSTGVVNGGERYVLSVEKEKLA